MTADPLGRGRELAESLPGGAGYASAAGGLSGMSTWLEVTCLPHLEQTVIASMAPAQS